MAFGRVPFKRTWTSSRSWSTDADILPWPKDTIRKSRLPSKNHEAGTRKCSVAARLRRAHAAPARLAEMSQAIFVKVIYIGAPYPRRVLDDVNFDYGQIQWQGLWPHHLVVLRSKTARKVRPYTRSSSVADRYKCAGCAVHLKR